MSCGSVLLRGRPALRKSVHYPTMTSEPNVSGDSGSPLPNVPGLEEEAQNSAPTIRTQVLRFTAPSNGLRDCEVIDQQGLVRYKFSSPDLNTNKKTTMYNSEGKEVASVRWGRTKRVYYHAREVKLKKFISSMSGHTYVFTHLFLSFLWEFRIVSDACRVRKGPSIQP